jgi:flavin-dependent dehydrogenase
MNAARFDYIVVGAGPAGCVLALTVQSQCLGIALWMLN